MECETLFLVGDIIDGWQLRRQWYWPQAHNDVVQKLLRKARKGTRVIFVPGNHDEFARNYVQHNFGGVDVVDDWIHETGRRPQAVGDARRPVRRRDPVRAVAGLRGRLGLRADAALNRHLNSLRARLGLPYWSLSRYLKLKVKRAVSYVGDFEAGGRPRGAHSAACTAWSAATSTMPRCATSTACCTANDGDWVESLTALVEHADGRLEIIDWARHEAALKAALFETPLPLAA